MNEILGRGAFSVVKKGTYASSPVAIRHFVSHFVTMETSETRDIVSQLRKEVKMMETLRHVNVIHIYGLCSELPTTLMVVMELAECSLDYCIYNRRLDLPIPARYNIMLGIVAGLDYAHGKGVLHCDIKSFNVLVKTRGSFDPENFKLTDFCLARDPEDNNSVTLLSHNPSNRWLAPEASEGGRDYHFTKAADVYSLGMLFYELLSRHIPYEGLGDREFYRELDRQGRPDSIFPVEDGVAKEAVELMRACWAEVPLERPSVTDVGIAVKALQD